jgi:hypothetical protein
MCLFLPSSTILPLCGHQKCLIRREQKLLQKFRKKVDLFIILPLGELVQLILVLNDNKKI